MKFENAVLRQLDALSHDWAVADKGRPLEMAVRLPEGKYKVVTGIGAAGVHCWLNHLYQPMSALVEVNGKKVFSRIADEQRDRFRMLKHDASPEDDLYELYVKPFLHDVMTEAETVNGEIRVTVTAPEVRKVPLNYLLIYPVNDPECGKLLERMLENRKLKFQESWRDVSPVEADIRNPLSADSSILYKNNAPVLFARENPYEYIFRQTLPLVSEIGVPLKIIATPGELASGAFLLRSPADLKNVTLELRGFPDFLRGNLFAIMNYHHTHAFTKRHWIAPNHLLPVKARDIPANQSFGYLLRFRLPETASPGIYRGTVRAVASSGERMELPVELHIPPFQLPVLEDHLIAMLGGQNDMAEVQMRFSRDELECTTATRMYSWPYVGSRFIIDQEGRIVDFEKIGGASKKEIDAWFKLYRRIGFPVKTPFVSLMGMGYVQPLAFGSYKAFSEEYRQAVKAAYGKILEIARNNGCESVVLDLGGEMGHDTKVPAQKTLDDAVTLFRMIKRDIPDIMTSYRANCYASVENFAPVLDVMGVRGSRSWEYSDRITDSGRKKHIYTYSVSGRFLNGLHSWSHGARGNLREWLTWSHCIEYNDFFCQGACGGTAHFEAMQGPEKSLIPTLRSEAFRASVVDRRYLRLLENAVEKAPASEAKTNAENFLALLRDIGNVERDISAGIPCRNGDNPWNGVRLDLVREICLHLTSGLRGKDAGSVLPRFSRERRERQMPLEVTEIDTGKTPARARADYDDSHWIPIKVGMSWEAQGIPYDGYAWYRNTFRLPDGWTQPVIHFGAADETAWVWLNGVFLGMHDGWDKPFSFPLKSWRPGRENTLAVLVLDRASMGGLWKKVSVFKDEVAEQKSMEADSIPLQSGWKLILEPGKRKLNEFGLCDGPFQRAGIQAVAGSLFMVPETDADARRIAGFDAALVVMDENGKELRRQSLGRIAPYRNQPFILETADLLPGRYSISLTVGGKQLAKYHFYLIPPVNTEKLIQK
ncbi:MAG TPA: hypothetical protein DE060_19580 [Lentisphaeria bacterium]|nr:hypothetical protein [Lentisphaeria bacterium]HCG51390.1 hypothetical protein [Lentisphaeria bacterium]